MYTEIAMVAVYEQGTFLLRENIKRCVIEKFSVAIWIIVIIMKKFIAYNWYEYV